MMFTPMFSVARAQGAAPGPRRIFGALIAGTGLFCVFSLAALLVFLTPYHKLRDRAAAFHASPNCRTGFASAAMPSASATPCTIEWANVLNRYYTSSHSSRSSTYRYYLRIRGGYGDEHTVEVTDNNVWWRTRNGHAVKMQRWGDRLTAITLVSGETSPTAVNPDWELRNDERGLEIFAIMFIVTLSLEAASLVLLRQLYG